MNTICRIIYFLKLFSRKNFFGFILGNDFLTDFHRRKIYTLIRSPHILWQANYETELSAILGGGKVITYASGRMAFYSILKTLNLQKDDEVILTGFTCSVMVNAVVRTGAKVIFADIDPDTFGSSPLEISKLISKKTKVIVAQHSFGIPCKIDIIQRITKEKNIFLIEDCALSFMSKYKGITLGNWGDAAIFSTDHSKPLNTLIGGFAYTNSLTLFESLKDIHKYLPDIPIKQQYKIYHRICFEAKYFNPGLYRFLKLKEFIDIIFHKIFGESKVPIFLISDISSIPIRNSYYPYPSKFPVFLSYLGLLELEKYKTSIHQRKLLMRCMLDDLSLKVDLPASYNDSDNDIVPLRLAFCTESKIIHNEVSKFIDVDWFWFTKPIESTPEDLTAFSYIPGSCPVAERVGKTIVNIPCIFYSDDLLLKYVQKIKYEI